MSTVFLDIFFRDHGAATGMNDLKKAAVGLVAGAGIALVLFGKHAVSMASDTVESQNKVQVVFGKSSQSVTTFSSTAAKSMGISSQAANEAASTFGNLLGAIKLPQPQMAAMSTKLVKLASDMSSFNNADPTQVLLDLRSGLVGQVEPLRKYGIELSDVSLRQEAMSLGLTNTTHQVLPQAIKMQAAYSLIFKQSAIQQGDFARTSNGLANRQRILSAEFSDMTARIGSGLLPMIVNITGSFISLIGFIQKNSTAFRELLGVVVGLSVAFATLRIISLITALITPFLAAVTVMGSVMTVVKIKMMETVAFLGGPWGIALIAATSIIGFFAARQSGASEQVKTLTESLNQQSGALTEATKTTVYKSLADAGAIDSAKKLGISLADVTDAALGNTDALGRVNDQYAAYKSSHVWADIANTRDAWSNVTSAITDQSGSVADARKAVADMGAAGLNTSNSQKTLEGSTKKVATAADKEKSAFDHLKDTLDKMNGKTQDVTTANIAYLQSIKALTDSLKQNGHSFDITTEKGQANTTALIDAAQKAEDYVVALRNTGATAGTVARAENKQREALIKSMVQMGLNSIEAQKLVDKYYKFPKTVETKLLADKSDLERKIADGKASLNSLPKDKQVQMKADLAQWERKLAQFKSDLSNIHDENVHINVALENKERALLNSWGYKFADGGEVHGNGTETSDSVPTNLSRSEHVWSAREVRGAGGHDAMRQMRATARNMALGGEVGINVIRPSASAMNAATKLAGKSLISADARALGNFLVHNLLGGLLNMAGRAGTGPAAAIGKAMAARVGWVGPQWTALNAVAMRESGWRWNAQNPTSSAYGIPQALPGSKMASAGPDWRTNPVTQIRWMLGYIRSRYGSPLGALAHEKSHGWYDDGGMSPQSGIFHRTKPERVLSPGQTQSFENLVRVLDKNQFSTSSPQSSSDPIDYNQLAGAMVRAFTRSGIAVQLDGRAVGRVQGTRADLLSRAG